MAGFLLCLNFTKTATLEQQKMKTDLVSYNGFAELDLLEISRF